MKSQLCYPRNLLGWVETMLDKEHVDFLWNRINHTGDDYRSSLAGNISKSYKIEDTDDFFCKTVLEPHAVAYKEKCGALPIRSYTRGESTKIELLDFWVNFQYEHEFNPYHHHAGIYSFVVWLKIPYHWKEQNALTFLEGMQAHDKKPGVFEFEYISILGDIETHCYRLDPSLEATMLFFPAALRHTVYPFYETKEPRISVSGNLGIKVG